MIKDTHAGVFYYGFLSGKEENPMIFEQPVNIYSQDYVLKRFQSNETAVQVVRGKISALISESELIELQKQQGNHVTVNLHQPYWI